ncbi:uncharacterized protein PAC_17828 [Phialocephala subalpina]|uniref:Uncharacterized protein n=1 Tax=Phialocephala subalpina TaxID=576137 RepID=A0A1L7XSH7_9HELO|nr:uncharacterized protein PAC_17828 [Phialocephala subalpina]
MLFTLPLLALCGLSSAKSKRSTSGGDITLYAYGGETNGAPVFYSDGLAYIGYSESNTAANITFTISANASSEPWYISQNTTSSPNTTSVFTGTPFFYIIPDGYQQAGFAKNSSVVPSGAATTGFRFYGSAVAYSSELEQAFWAVDTNTTGIYALYWGLVNSNVENSTSIILKSTPPVGS